MANTIKKAGLLREFVWDVVVDEYGNIVDDWTWLNSIEKRNGECFAIKHMGMNILNNSHYKPMKNRTVYPAIYSWKRLENKF